MEARLSLMTVQKLNSGVGFLNLNNSFGKRLVSIPVERSMKPY